MAGPLSSEEIEDVVSSVRRLVSNEQNPRRTTRDLAADRLLLTSSLRVVSELSPLAPLVLDAPMPAETSVPEVEAVSDPEPADLDEDAVELIEADWEDELWTATEPVSLGEIALASDEAEVLAHPAADPSDSVPEALIEDPDDVAAAWGHADWSEEEPVPFIPLRRRAEDLAARLAAGGVRDPEDAEDEDLDDIAEASAAAEAQVAAPAVSPDVAPELLEDDLLTEDLGDAAEAAASGRMPTEILDADGTALAVLDEAALQEIVRQMIREELQGTLGERITRNVRKLVRAEINRALVARDLD